MLRRGQHQIPLLRRNVVRFDQRVKLHAQRQRVVHPPRLPHEIGRMRRAETQQQRTDRDRRGQPSGFCKARQCQQRKRPEPAREKHRDDAVVAVKGRSVQRLAHAHGEEIHPQQADEIEQPGGAGPQAQTAQAPVPARKADQQHRRRGQQQPDKPPLPHGRPDHGEGDAAQILRALLPEGGAEALQADRMIGVQAVFKGRAHMPGPQAVCRQHPQQHGARRFQPLSALRPQAEGEDHQQPGKEPAAVFDHRQVGREHRQRCGELLQPLALAQAEQRAGKAQHGHQRVHQQIRQIRVAAETGQRAQQGQPGEAEAQRALPRPLRKTQQRRGTGRQQQALAPGPEPLGVNARGFDEEIDQQRAPGGVGREIDQAVVRRQRVASLDQLQDRAPVAVIVDMAEAAAVEQQEEKHRTGAEKHHAPCFQLPQALPPDHGQSREPQAHGQQQPHRRHQYAQHPAQEHHKAYGGEADRQRKLRPQAEGAHTGAQIPAAGEQRKREPQQLQQFFDHAFPSPSVGPSPDGSPASGFLSKHQTPLSPFASRSFFTLVFSPAGTPAPAGTGPHRRCPCCRSYSAPGRRS